MTFSQWQKNKELVAWAHHLFSQGNWDLLLQAINDVHPHRQKLPPIGSDSVKITRLGEIDGYNQCLDNLKKLAVFDNPKELPEPDFGAEEILKQQKTLTKRPTKDNT